MLLRELLQSIQGILTIPDHAALNLEVKGLCTASPDCQPGDLFIGMPGSRVDGGTFWPEAIRGGAIAAVVTEQALAQVPNGMAACLLPMDDPAGVCAQIAAKFYGDPAQTLAMVGVTGTNGKTTTTHLIEYFLQAAGETPALLGTLYSRWPGFYQEASHTTPFSVLLQGQLAQARTAGSTQAVMEVSSHALHQGRVKQCPFRVAVFTNLTQDHLDYHGTMEAYFEAKALLFSPEYLAGKAVINQDDVYGRRLLERLGERAWSYSTTSDQADFYPSDLIYGATGVRGLLHTPRGIFSFQSPLVGQFNLANMIAAIAAAMALGCDPAPMIAALPQFVGVPGRMERVTVGEHQDISVIVDYAHTPDGLKNLLKAARPFITGRMLCVFGCGGDRDRTKRPIMGNIAATLADLAIVTSDNPRTEDPRRILQDVVEGIPEDLRFLLYADRAEAIREAIAQAQPGDGVLIAGKGHEDYQILGTTKIHFDDREQARLALGAKYTAAAEKC